MALDLKSIGKIFKHVDLKTLGKIYKGYNDNKELVDGVLAMVLGIFAKKNEAKPSIPDDSVPGVPPTMPTAPKPDAPEGQVYFKLVTKLLFVEEDRHGGSRGETASTTRYNQILSENGPDALMVGERAHINITPFDAAGKEIGPDDPRHPGVEGTKEQNQYTMDYEWTVDGKVATSSQEMPDPFALESSWDDYGMTPVLLNETEGPGRQKVTFKAWIKPEYNGGVRTESNVLVFYKN